MALDRRENEIRRWHDARRGRYGHDRRPADLVLESGALLQAWRDIDYLVLRLDQMQAQAREAELAADDRRPTARDLPAIAEPERPRPETSDDTITWPPPGEERVAPDDLALPPAPPAPPVPLAPLLSQAELWNAAVAAVAIRAEAALAEASRRHLDVHATKALVAAAIAGCRRLL